MKKARFVRVKEVYVEGRSAFVFLLLLIFFMVLIGHLLMVSKDVILPYGSLKEVAQTQSKYTLTVDKGRGTIYDCNLKPLTNDLTTYKAVALPCEQSLKSIKELTLESDFSNIVTRLSNGNGILINIKNLPTKNIEKLYPFEVKQDSGTLASHILGYTNLDLVGVSALQKDYERYLSMGKNNCELTYSVDAMGRVLGGEEVEINDYLTGNRKGIVTTIDKDIQTIVQDIGSQMIKTGAIIVMDNKTGEIKAMESFPSFNTNSVEQYITGESSPLLNRNLASFNIGSLFKLVVAISAMENGINFDYFCDGTTIAGGEKFQCMGERSHGEVNLEKALAQSCNCYFIHLAQKIGGEKILQTASNLGLGKSIALSDSIVCSSGKLPSLNSVLNSQSQLANLSFGQGELMVTPLQMCAIISAIANNGIYNYPSLVKGKVSENGNYFEETGNNFYSAMSTGTAKNLKKYMITAVQSGSAYTANIENIVMGAKTATAETGIYVGSKAVIQGWIGGYFEVGNKEYSMVVLVEDAVTGSSSCGPVFKKIVETINFNL